MPDSHNMTLGVDRLFAPIKPHNQLSCFGSFRVVMWFKIHDMVATWAHTQKEFLAKRNLLWADLVSNLCFITNMKKWYTSREIGTKILWRSQVVWRLKKQALEAVCFLLSSYTTPLHIHSYNILCYILTFWHFLPEKHHSDGAAAFILLWQRATVIYMSHKPCHINRCMTWLSSGSCCRWQLRNLISYSPRCLVLRSCALQESPTQSRSTLGIWEVLGTLQRALPLRTVYTYRSNGDLRSMSHLQFVSDLMLFPGSSLNQWRTWKWSCVT